MTKRSPFRYFKTSPEIIRLAVMLYVRFPLSLRNVEDLLHERGIDVSHETFRYWWHRIGQVFAAEIRRRRIEGLKCGQWRWHLGEMFVIFNRGRHCLCQSPISINADDQCIYCLVVSCVDGSVYARVDLS